MYFCKAKYDSTKSQKLNYSKIHNLFRKLMKPSNSASPAATPPSARLLVVNTTSEKSTFRSSIQDRKKKRILPFNFYQFALNLMSISEQ